MATRLCQALLPLFEHQHHLGFEPRSSLHHSRTSVTDSTVDDRLSLIEIFQVALRIKAQLLTSTDSYEAVMYAPGSAFRANTMKPESSQGEKIGLLPIERPWIKCCYAPSLLAHKREHKLVDYNNFVRSTEGNRSECRPFTKALVAV